MFRKHVREEFLTVRNAENAVLAEGPLAEFPLEEEGILRSSVEFFQDPTPCEIHRAAVRSRSLAHLKKVCPPGSIIPLSSLDPLLQALFPGNAATVQITEVIS